MKITSKLKKQIKDIIKLYEYNNTGIRHINGGDVVAKNIRISWGENKIYADIELLFQMEGKTERYNDCEYPLNELIK